MLTSSGVVDFSHNTDRIAWVKTIHGRYFVNVMFGSIQKVLLQMLLQWKTGNYLPSIVQVWCHIHSLLLSMRFHVILKTCWYERNRSKMDLTSCNKDDHKQCGPFCSLQPIFPNKAGKLGLFISEPCLVLTHLKSQKPGSEVKICFLDIQVQNTVNYQFSNLYLVQKKNLSTHYFDYRNCL